MFGAFINSWRAPLRSSMPILRESVVKGLDSGETQYASYWGLSLSKHLLHQGVELPRVLVEVENAMAIGRRTNMRAGYDWQRPFRQLVRCLRGQTRGDDCLDGDDFDEHAYCESIAGEPYALSLYESIRLQLHYLARNFAAAQALAESSRARLVFQRGTPAMVDHNFYTSLTLAARAGDDERAAAVAAIAVNQQQLEVWASNCPENYRHKHLLVGAELARLREQDSEAAALYDQAIEAAGRERFLQDQALANELAGRYYLSRGRRHIASLYLSSALSVYARWGATAKLDAIEREFSSLLGPLWGPTRDGQGVATIDLLAILKAAEAISTEVVLDRLLETLLDVCMASAGAERGALLLLEEGELFVRVWGSVAEAATLDRTPVGASTRVPAAIIEHVLTSGEPLVLDDAMHDPGFKLDAYVAQHAVRSVLALPIRKQAKLVGVLYLESSLVTRVFTAERLRILQLLSSQIAISLENGLLFERLTAEMRERTRAEQSMRVLADAGIALSESLAVQTILDRLVQLVVPQLADWCTVEAFEARDLRRVAGAHVDQGRAPLLAQLIERHPARWDSSQPASRCLRDGRSLLLPEITHAMLHDLAEDEDHENLLRELDTQSAMEVPLTIRGRTIGVITLVSARAYEWRDLALAEELARRVAIAIENARLYRETQDAVRMRDEFLSVASHELNTPMTSLRLSLQNLLAQAAEAPLDAGLVVKTATLAERQGRRLTLLIHDLLDVTRLERGTPRLELREHDLALLVRGVLAGFAPELERVGCVVQLTAPAPVRGCWDGLRIEQVVLNLLANAAKFGVGKPIEITVDRVGERARLVIRDHGIGIDPARQAHIFDRFERAVSATHYGGLGLGLYICRRLVEAHGGTVRVASEPGAGSTFVVELPIVAENRIDDTK
jgi:signal transduction histidine kinase